MYFAEQPDFVHRPQNGRDIAALVQNLQERLRARARPSETRGSPGESWLRMRLRQVGVQPQSALLRIEKHAHQPPRLIVENAGRHGRSAPSTNLETIHDLLRHARLPARNMSLQRRNAVRCSAASARRCSSVRVIR